MSAEQDFILKEIEDPKVAAAIAAIWRQVEGEPLAAARMLRAFQSVKSLLNETMAELPAQWEQLESELAKADVRRTAFSQDLADFRKGSLAELAAAVKDLREVQAFFAQLDDDKFLNKANRVLEVCDKLAKAKRDGTFDLLKRLI